MAKKKSIFDDRQLEIEELTNIIKTDLSSLNKQIAQLQELGRKQRESSSQGHHIASHSSSVVVALQSKLANMSNHFKSVLEVRSEVSKIIVESVKFNIIIKWIFLIITIEYEGRTKSETAIY